MNLFNLMENTTGGYDNLRALLQAVSTRSPADLNIGGEPITLDYMEANFLNGIYRAYLKAGRQEEFIQDLGDARRFDMHMKKLREQHIVVFLNRFVRCAGCNAMRKRPGPSKPPSY